MQHSYILDADHQKLILPNAILCIKPLRGFLQRKTGLFPQVTIKRVWFHSLMIWAAFMRKKPPKLTTKTNALVVKGVAQRRISPHSYLHMKIQDALTLHKSQAVPHSSDVMAID
jgi:hypothetical protein